MKTNLQEMDKKSPLKNQNRIRQILALSLPL
jgi:hypothetical protein